MLSLNQPSRGGARLVLSCLAFVLVQPVLAEERIREFDAQIRVLPNGDVEVTETIRVMVEGAHIDHGIYRDFPVKSFNKLAMRRLHAFQVLEVRRDDRDEPYHLAEGQGLLQNVTRVYIGSEHESVPLGEHTYVLRYQTSDWLDFQEDCDQLYWNVTGNEWLFPIDRVTATVRLPGELPREQIDVRGWTGSAGSQAQNWKLVERDTSRVQVETTVALEAKQGLTMQVRWPRGEVDRGESSHLWGQVFRDNRGSLLALSATILAAVLYGVCWIVVGKNPASRVVIPSDSPPAGLSPVAARYLKRMGYDHQCFATALVSAAQSGAIAIEEKPSSAGPSYEITAASPTQCKELPKAESIVVESLLSKKNRIVLGRRHTTWIQEAIAKLRKYLKENIDGTWFQHNRFWLLPGLLVSLLGVVGGALLNGNLAIAGFMTLWLSLWSIGVAMLAAAVLTAWKAVLTGPRLSRITAGIGALFITAFATPFFLGEIAGLGLLCLATSPWVGLSLLVSVAMAVLFARWMKAPTLQGREWLDRVDAYQMWLETVLPGRLSTLADPQQAGAPLPAASALDHGAGSGAPTCLGSDDCHARCAAWRSSGIGLSTGLVHRGRNHPRHHGEIRGRAGRGIRSRTGRRDRHRDRVCQQF